MLRDLIEFPIVTDKVSWDARQVLRDMGEEGKTHIFLRIKLSGTHFDQRALEPYVVVGRVRSKFVEISEDGLTARAYFDKPLKSEGVIEFGYGEETLFRVKKRYEPLDVMVLTPKLLRGINIQYLDRFFPDID